MPRLLLAKLGAIGDVIMAIPAAHAMYAQGYQVDWICGRAVAPLLRLYPWIQPIEVDERALLLGSHVDRLKVILRLWRFLARRGRYDLSVILYRDARYRLLTFFVRARQKAHLSDSLRNTQLVPGRHHTSEYARILLAQRTEFSADSEACAQYPPVLPHPFPPTTFPRTDLRPRVILVPGGARNLLRDDLLRRWPIEHYTELARALLELGCEVLLAGGPDDVWASAHFSSFGITDMIGKLSLVDSISLFDSADLVVSHDTGPLHMAGLSRASILAIFGPTNPSVFLPQRPNVMAIWGGEGFACRPCYDGRNFAPCVHNGCMHQVSPAMVLEGITKMLQARKDGRLLMPQIVVPAHTPLVNLSVPTRATALGESIS